MKLMCLYSSFVGEPGPDIKYAQIVTLAGRYTKDGISFLEFLEYLGWGYSARGFVPLGGPDERKIKQKRNKIDTRIWPELF